MTELQKLIEKDSKEYWLLQEIGGNNADEHFAAGLTACINNPGRYGIGPVWVKADTNPTKDHNYHVKVKGFSGSVYNDAVHWDNRWGWANKIEVIEWLDESDSTPSPDTGVLVEALKWYADPGNYLGDNGELATAWKNSENIANKAKEALKKYDNKD
jgi:hypothetical protein